MTTDKDKNQFLDILRTGKVSQEQKSPYAANYRFFQKQIDEFQYILAVLDRFAEKIGK